MAKIYETQEDYKRDKLSEQIQVLKDKSHGQSRTGWTLFIGSLIVDTFTLSRGKANTWLTALSLGLTAGWGVQIFKAWKTDKQVRDLQLEKTKLGPEAIVLPEGVMPEKGEKAAVQAAVEHESCDECTRKKLAKPIHRRTVLEMAEKKQIGGSKEIH